MGFWVFVFFVFFLLPGVSKGCCLEVFKYLASKKHGTFVTPGRVLTKTQKKHLKDLVVGILTIFVLEKNRTQPRFQEVLV